MVDPRNIDCNDATGTEVAVVVADADGSRGVKRKRGDEEEEEETA